MGTVSVNGPETPEVGWAVQASGEYATGQQRSATVKSWLSLRNLLAFILVLWNGYFLASLLYGLSVQSPSRDAIIRIVVNLWLWGDVAILLVAWSIWAIRRRRRNAA